MQCGISARVARGVNGGRTSRKPEEKWQSIYGQRPDMGFPKRPYSKKAGELLNLNRNQVCIMTDLFYWKLSLKKSSI